MASSVTLEKAPAPFNSAEVEVDGKAWTFDQGLTVSDVPEKVVKRLGEDDLKGFSFKIDSQKGA